MTKNYHGSNEITTSGHTDNTCVYKYCEISSGCLGGGGQGASGIEGASTKLPDFIILLFGKVV